MPQSLSRIYVHLVFSTKDRVPHISDELKPALHAYLATVTRNAGCECFRVGGVADHIHIALGLPRTVTVAKVVEIAKSNSSAWAKNQGAPAFSWQRGYAALSFGQSELDRVVAYIDGQEEHHAKMTFQDEYRRILTEFGIDFDERFVWD